MPTSRRPAKQRRDCPQMYFKTATILAWFFGAYFAAALRRHTAGGWSSRWRWSSGLAMAAIGFNIQHDGGHKAYSDRQWVNKIMALTLDLMGGSSYLWDWKHNSIHHTYPNIDGHDDDINVGFLGRLSPAADALLVPSPAGHLSLAAVRIPRDQVALLRRLLQRRHRPHRRAQDPAPQGQGSGRLHRRQDRVLLAGVRHPDAAASVVGRARRLRARRVRQRRGAERRLPARPLRRRGRRSPCRSRSTDGSERMETDWAVHQVQTTVDFARRNPRALLVPRRIEFPDRASPVQPNLPHPLPGAVEGRRRNLPGVRHQLRRPQDASSARGDRTIAGWCRWAGRCNPRLNPFA